MCAAALVVVDAVSKRSKTHQVLIGAADVTSSVITLKPASVQGPNEVTIATSVASRPRAIRMRPMRGTLFRGSKVYQRPPRYASNQAAKSPGSYGGGAPMSPR